MILQEIILARAIRFVPLSRLARGYVPDTAALMRERYKFVHIPESPDQILAEGYGPPTERRDGLLFAHGRLMHGEREIVIDRFGFYPQLIAVDTPTGTEDSDLVIEDLLSDNPEIKAFAAHRRAYMSQLVVKLDVSLDAVFEATAEVGAGVADMLAAYVDEEAPAPPLQALSFAMGTDKRVLPCAFRIERRLNTSFEADLYFSEAPLSSSDHADALGKFEQSLLRVLRRGGSSGAG